MEIPWVVSHNLDFLHRENIRRPWFSFQPDTWKILQGARMWAVSPLAKVFTGTYRVNHRVKGTGEDASFLTNEEKTTTKKKGKLL